MLWQTSEMEGDEDNYYTNPKFDYDPVSFIKCHSKIKGDKNDRITKVWMCAFEPNPDFPEKTTDVIATCGANSVCILDVKKGRMLTKHYSKHDREEFYTLSWSTLFMNDMGKTVLDNILAVAGAKCTVHLLHPSHKVCFFEEKIKMPSKVTISSLQFHPLARTVLCGGFSSGEVHIWDLGKPSFPDYKMNFTRIHRLSIESEIINMSFSRHCRTLLAATDNGVVAWALDLVDLNVCNGKKEKSDNPNERIKMWRFNFACRSGISSVEDQLVDTVEPIQTGKMVASKCALYGNIFLWDLEEAMQYCEMGGKVKVDPVHTLTYSKTDNYYMSMGSSILSGLLACGDDIGNIWLYDMSEVLSLSHREQEQSAVIPWPEVDDVHCKWMVQQNEVVINKVVVNYNGIYIVAVTNNNLVCIWRKK